MDLQVLSVIVNRRARQTWTATTLTAPVLLTAHAPALTGSQAQIARRHRVEAASLAMERARPSPVSISTVTTRTRLTRVSVSLATAASTVSTLTAQHTVPVLEMELCASVTADTLDSQSGTQSWRST